MNKPSSPPRPSHPYRGPQLPDIKKLEHRFTSKELAQLMATIADVRREIDLGRFDSAKREEIVEWVRQFDSLRCAWIPNAIGGELNNTWIAALAFGLGVAVFSALAAAQYWKSALLSLVAALLIAAERYTAATRAKRLSVAAAEVEKLTEHMRANLPPMRSEQPTKPEASTRVRVDARAAPPVDPLPPPEPNRTMKRRKGRR